MCLCASRDLTGRPSSILESYDDVSSTPVFRLLLVHTSSSPDQHFLTSENPARGIASAATPGARGSSAAPVYTRARPRGRTI